MTDITDAMERAGARALIDAHLITSQPGYLVRKVYKAMEAARGPMSLGTDTGAASNQIDAPSRDADSLTRPSRDSRP